MIGSTGVWFNPNTKSNKYGNKFFSHSKTNSCGVLATYLATNDLTVKKTKKVVIQFLISPSIYFHQLNTEKEKVDVLRNLFVLLEEFDTDPKKTIIYGGRF